MDPLTIGKAAKNTGVGVETIRFYERAGLILQPQTRSQGYRQYGPEILRRIRFIQRAKSLGFSLREVAELLALRMAHSGSCAAVRSHALSKIEDIDAKISALQQIRSALLTLSEACARPGPATECPILDALDPEEFPEEPCARLS